MTMTETKRKLLDTVTQTLILGNRYTQMNSHKIYLKLINAGVNWVLGTYTTPYYCYCVSLQHKSRKYLNYSTIKGVSNIKDVGTSSHSWLMG